MMRHLSAIIHYSEGKSLRPVVVSYFLWSDQFLLRSEKHPVFPARRLLKPMASKPHKRDMRLIVMLTKSLNNRAEGTEIESIG